MSVLIGTGECTLKAVAHIFGMYQSSVTP